MPSRQQASHHGQPPQGVVHGERVHWRAEGAQRVVAAGMREEKQRREHYVTQRGVKKANGDKNAAEKSASTRYTYKKSTTKSLKKGAAKKAQPAKKPMAEEKVSLPKKPKKPAAKKPVTPKKTPKN
ncbi:histone H1-gamma, late-like [Dermacentor silvarum]|uniref:histone H1-gamma, late-like n=1 Tax=Dermacentor silvarum TaxID=543639 RepID=UPI001896EB93|nr:histone H1-gamma, late-like [Dermacentor silvarum]